MNKSWDNTKTHGLIKDGIELHRDSTTSGACDTLKAHRSSNSGNLVIKLVENEGTSVNVASGVWNAEDALAFGEWLVRTFKGKGK